MKAALAVSVAAFALVYVPAIGRGFIKDDFVWIATSRVGSAADVAALFASNTGFYRPLVSLTFAADHALWGLNALGYGVTNLVLAVACPALLFALARAFGLPRTPSVVGAAAWAFNFHAVNMALLWVSGRTALLATLFSLGTAHAMLADARLAAAALALGAMLAKEEAVLLPMLFAAFLFVDHPAVRAADRARHAAARTWPLWGSLLVYLALRSQSGAMTPLDAPPYYQFSPAPALVARNVAEYADRACTVGIAVALVLWLAVRERPRLLAPERRAVVFGAIWLAMTYALTMFLPVRSSLYALLPSAGVALGVASFASWALRTNASAFSRAVAALALLVLMLVPVYRARNVRWTALADVSSQVMHTVREVAARRPEGGRIVLLESPGERFNLDAAFGTMFPDAVALYLGPRWSGEVVAEGHAPHADGSLVFRFANGRLTRAP